jgi:hypothetical protein
MASTLATLPTLTASLLTNLWQLSQVRRRIRKARALAGFARGIGAVSPGVRGAERAARLRRKALRTLDPPPAGGAADPFTGLPDGVALRELLDRRLADQSLLGQLIRHRRPIARTSIPSILVLAVLIAAVPPIRKFFFPPDLAFGKRWTATSALAGFSTTGSVSDDDSTPAMFHTLEEPFPAVTVDLGALVVIRKVRVVNRLDCCRERALPLAVEIGSDGVTWKRVGYRRSEFRRWAAVFPAVRARFVRVRVDRQSTLHLRTISIY